MDDLWSAVKVRAWAELTTVDGETVELECSGVVIDYGLNEIPQCVLTIGVGRDVRGLQNAAIHNVISTWQALLPVKVFAEITTTSGTFWPNDPVGEVMIFDGVTSYAGYRKVYGRVEFVLNISHWLVKLGFSSILSNASSPNNPVQVSFPANLPLFGNNAGAGADGAVTQALPLISTAATRDFWGQGIKNLLTYLCNKKRYDWQNLAKLGADCAGAGGIANATALEALNRFEPGADGYVDGVPSKLRAELADGAILKGISYAISHETVANLARTTVWDKIVGEYVQNYRLMLVPMVNKALVVPFTPGLRQGVVGAKSWRTIYAREIDYFDMNATLPRPVRAVGLMIKQAMAAGALPSSRTEGIPDFISGALYDTCGDGVALFMDAPPWIANYNLPNGLSKKELVTGNVPTNQDPAVGPPEPPPSYTKRFALWKEYCHGLYVQEVLQHRQARLAGKVRFDICPGSSVRMEVPEDRFVAAQAGQGDEILFGTVMRVTTTLNSEDQKAGTAFHVSFVRSGFEDEDDKTSVASNPIWEKDFFGASLV